MRQQINKINLFLLLSISIFLLSCSDDKNYYDPERENENPLELIAPSNFAWQTTRSTSVKVEVKDEFDGQFNYGIKISVLNPVTGKGNTQVLASGVAKQGQAFKTQIALPFNVEGVYIQQIAPDGLISVCYADATNGSIHCDFGATRSNKSRSTGTNPDPNPGNKDTEPEPYPYPFTYLFEDLWPFYDDYDMNDAVIQITQITKFRNDKNAITALSFDYSLKAVGTGSSLGAALMLDAINASSVSSVTYSPNTPSGFETTSSGVESGQSQAVIPLFANAHNFLRRNPGQLVNTVKGSSTNVADVPTVTVKIEFSTPISDNFDATTFNLFIIPSPIPEMITSSDRREVHMLGYNPSNRASTTYFGNNDDRSTNSKYYVSKDNLSWAIVVPYDIRWPQEHKSIKLAYEGFERWVTSGGSESPTWWLTPNEGLVY